MSKKRVLFVATVFRFMNFEISDMNILIEKGYEIHIATNFSEYSSQNNGYNLQVLNAVKHQIDFARKPFSKDSLKAFVQLKQLINKEQFELIHCHTPIAAAITRLSAVRARKKGTYIIYTSHGFHFHAKSSVKDWIIYYPIERILAPKTDMIITINHEDFRRIESFSVKEKKYIPGVGIDIEGIKKRKVDVNEIKKMFNIPENSITILSIGELSNRKNHKVLIKALSIAKNKNIVYLICGEGDKEEELKQLSAKLKLQDRVKLLGQISHDRVIDLCHIVDIGAITSKIEGLGLAGLEPMAAGKPILASNIHGILDYAKNGVDGFTCDPDDIKGFAKAIDILSTSQNLRDLFGKAAQLIAQDFSIENSNKAMRDIYEYVDIEIQKRKNLKEFVKYGDK